MNSPQDNLAVELVEESKIAEGLQCCLLCGRTLTNRALHDALEEPVLESIRLEHPEWSQSNGTCQPCIEYYRHLLGERLTRAENLRAAEQKDKRLLPVWINKLLHRTRTMNAAAPGRETS
jgi:hypothetical protein